MVFATRATIRDDGYTTFVDDEPEERALIHDLRGLIHFATPVDSGIRVTPELALTASAVFACVNVISTTIATLPLHVHARKDGAKQDAHPLYGLLHDTPNDLMGAATFVESMMVALLLYGNAYAAIDRDASGRPIALWPLLPQDVLIARKGRRVQYQVRRDEGETLVLTPDRMLHIAHMSLDGLQGMAPILYARQQIGLSLAMEQFASRFFGNGANVGGVIEAPAGLKPDSLRAFHAEWKEKFGGPENAFKTALLPDGMKYNRHQVEPEKAQMVQSRVHQLREAARIYRVPPHKIGDLERATFSNIEEQNIEFVQDCIGPWCVKWEQEISRKLLLENERGALLPKFNLDALLRGNTAARYAAHATALNAGFVTVNEVRAKENLPPVDGGDVLRVPLNTGPAVVDNAQNPPNSKV